MANPYAPVTLGARMSDYGYWIVEISVAPGQRMSVMVAKIGITQQEAIDLVAEVAPFYPAPKGGRLCLTRIPYPCAHTDARSDAATLTTTSS